MKPSLEQIEQTERHRSKAIESLQISGSMSSVRDAAMLFLSLVNYPGLRMIELSYCKTGLSEFKITHMAARLPKRIISEKHNKK